MSAMYRVNRNPRGGDVIHDERPLEECNVDDAIDREWVDHQVALDMVGKGSARACRHCLVDGLPPE